MERENMELYLSWDFSFPPSIFPHYCTSCFIDSFHLPGKGKHFSLSRWQVERDSPSSLAFTLIEIIDKRRLSLSQTGNKIFTVITLNEDRPLIADHRLKSLRLRMRITASRGNQDGGAERILDAIGWRLVEFSRSMFIMIKEWHLWVDEWTKGSVPLYWILQED